MRRSLTTGLIRFSSTAILRAVTSESRAACARRQ